MNGDMLKGWLMHRMAKVFYKCKMQRFYVLSIVCLGTISILRQQMDWVGGVGKMVIFAEVQYYLCCQLYEVKRWQRRGGGGPKSPILRRHSLWTAPCYVRRLYCETINCFIYVSGSKSKEFIDTFYWCLCLVLHVCESICHSWKGPSLYYVSKGTDWVGGVRKMAFLSDVQYYLCWRRVSQKSSDVVV